MIGKGAGEEVRRGKEGEGERWERREAKSLMQLAARTSHGHWKLSRHRAPCLPQGAESCRGVWPGAQLAGGRSSDVTSSLSLAQHLCCRAAEKFQGIPRESGGSPRAGHGEHASSAGSLLKHVSRASASTRAW
eukprot:747543-Hanusia_phi.AAC.3